MTRFTDPLFASYLMRLVELRNLLTTLYRFENEEVF